MTVSLSKRLTNGMWLCESWGGGVEPCYYASLERGPVSVFGREIVVQADAPPQTEDSLFVEHEHVGTGRTMFQAVKRA